MAIMNKAELAAFIRKQAKMAARIAEKANRAKAIAQVFCHATHDPVRDLTDRIVAAIDRPGVAPSSRPKSKTGAETFHFSLTTVNKQGSFGKAHDGVPKEAGDFGRYIEREGAAEAIHPEIARSARTADEVGWEALGGQRYIERPEAAEVVQGRKLASFGNIAGTFEERIAFWQAVEATAATPKTNGIELQRGHDPSFWEKVDADPNAPSLLKDAPPFVALPADPRASVDAEALNAPDWSWQPPPRVNDAEAMKVFSYWTKHKTRGIDRRTPAASFDPGRGGRIQTRLIVELPHDLSPEQRLGLAKTFCHDRFVKDREAPVLHWCVIHAPDEHNDPRNVHMHIVFSERPAKRMPHPETGKEVWDFEIVETTTDRHRNTRSRRPFEQTMARDLNHRDWVIKARKRYAELANAALIAAGKKKIYDPRSYKEMGIEETPRERINPKDYTRERKGISTEAGLPAVTQQWEREEARLVKRFANMGPNRKVLRDFDIQIERWKTQSRTSAWAHLGVHRHEYAIAAAIVKMIEADAAASAFVLAKIKSKILPPLKSDEAGTIAASDFVRLYNRDIVLKYQKELRIQKRNRERSLMALEKAMAADPRVETDTSFLTGANSLAARTALLMGSLPRPKRHDQSVEEVFKDWRDGIQETVDEGREIRAAQSEQIAAREGRLLPPGSPELAGKPGAASPPRATPTAPRPAATVVPEQPPLPSLANMSPEQKKRYLENLDRALGPAKPAPPKFGDEVLLPFLSDEGAPLQYREFSKKRIQEADDHAAAVIAAIEARRKKRAEEALQNGDTPIGDPLTQVGAMVRAAEKKEKAARAARRKTPHFYSGPLVPPEEPTFSTVEPTSTTPPNMARTEAKPSATQATQATQPSPAKPSPSPDPSAKSPQGSPQAAPNPSAKSPDGSPKAEANPSTAKPDTTSTDRPSPGNVKRPPPAPRPKIEMPPLMPRPPTPTYPPELTAEPPKAKAAAPVTPKAEAPGAAKAATPAATKAAAPETAKVADTAKGNASPTPKTTTPATAQTKASTPTPTNGGPPKTPDTPQRTDPQQRLSSPEVLRRRALMAARNRGRSR